VSKPRAGVSAIYSQMAAVMVGIDAISKDRKNLQQGFNFRGIDQAYNAIHPLMALHQIITVPRVLEMTHRYDRTTARGGVMAVTVIKVEYDFISGLDGSKITVGPVFGEAMDSGDKGCNKALAVAHKYCLFQTFLIPTEKSDDPDFDSHEMMAEPTMSAAPAPAPTPDAQPQVITNDLSGVSVVAIPNAEEATKAADLIISMTASASSSVQALAGYWAANKQVIDYLDQSYNDEYQRVKAAFTQIRSNIEQAQTA